jgi:hypothetical protein
LVPVLVPILVPHEMSKLHFGPYTGQIGCSLYKHFWILKVFEGTNVRTLTF